MENLYTCENDQRNCTFGIVLKNYEQKKDKVSSSR